MLRTFGLGHGRHAPHDVSGIVGHQQRTAAIHSDADRHKIER
jgi:hypothetical protein